MANSKPTPSTDIDDSLAAFTDRILAGGPEEARQSSLENEELRELEQTVMRLQKAVLGEQAAGEEAQAALTQATDQARERIWKQVRREIEAQPGRHAGRSLRPEAGLLDRLQQQFGRLFGGRPAQRWGLALGLSGALALIAIAAILFSDQTGAPLQGTAGGPGMFLLVIVAVMAAILVWAARGQK